MNCTQCGKLLPEANSPFCPFCGGSQSRDSANSSTEQVTTEQPTPMQTVAEQLEAAQSEQPTAAMGGFQPAAAGSGTAFDPTLPQQPEKKRLPAWVIALIAGGIALVLAICCCVAMVAFFADEFMEEFEREFNAAVAESATNLDPIDTDLIATSDTNGNDSDITTDTDSAALIQNFINEYSDVLLAGVDPLLSGFDDGTRMELLAADYELIYAFTFGSDFLTDELAEVMDIQELFDGMFDAMASVYEDMAGYLADELGLGSMTITVRYYDANGTILTDRSFHSR